VPGLHEAAGVAATWRLHVLDDAVDGRQSVGADRTIRAALSRWLDELGGVEVAPGPLRLGDRGPDLCVL
jgi:hypothetical protein